MAKVTMATVKSFIRKNHDGLLIRVKSKFDGMTDCVESTKDDGFSPANFGAIHETNTLGVHGAWFVGGSRDSLEAFEANGLRGIKVYNCCGSFELAVKA